MQHFKPFSTLILGVALFGLCAIPALAQETTDGQTTAPQNTLQHDRTATQRPNQRMPRMSAQSRNMIVATVTSIDRNSGMVEATADGEDMRLPFTPDSLADINEGDTVTLFVALRKGDTQARRMELRQQRQQKALQGQD